VIVAASLAVAGWLAALTLVVVLVGWRRRFELVARAEHELRGPAAALLLAVERMRRDPRTRPAAGSLLLQLERLRAGLAELAAARAGRRAGAQPVPVSLRAMAAQAARGAQPLAAADGRRVEFDWRAGAARVRADRGKLAQVLANLTANAVEHGSGTVEVRGEEAGGNLRIEVRDEGAPRGRGISIAADAAREAGGELSFLVAPGGTSAVLEVPLEEDGTGLAA
jgi:signal transduction histidine kinase